jgi:hypothetical protein
MDKGELGHIATVLTKDGTRNLLIWRDVVTLSRGGKSRITSGVPRFS